MTVEPFVAPEPAHRQVPALGTQPLPAGPLDWVARLPSASAPGFVYLAGACRDVSVGGGGRDLAEAEARLAGEAAEVLAQTAAPVATDAPGLPALDAAWTTAQRPLRIAATDASSGAAVGVPAAAVFLGAAAAERRPDAPPASLGLAAGRDPNAARLAALLELVERDAAARWWCEGVPPRQLDAAALAGAAADLARMRAEAAVPRAVAFLSLASPTGVPVACAFSRDRDGRGLALGLKAAPWPAAAAAGALVELMQMELALEMARHRSGRGAAAPADAGPLARAALRPEEFPAFAALPPEPAAPVPADFAGLAARLAGQGFPVVFADLPPAGGLAVAKIFVPGLLPLPGGGPARHGTPGAATPLM
ncbi:MAG: YcaO-like family protein [Amaricoccus sp.]